MGEREAHMHKHIHTRISLSPIKLNARINTALLELFMCSAVPWPEQFM